jgi:iron complex outermembrane recepter protein
MGKTLMRSNVCAVLLAGASTVAFTTSTYAQTPTQKLEEVVITGSRVIKNGDASPTPVTVLVAETLQTVQPTTLSDNLALIPVFSGSRGQLSNPSATGGVGGGNGVASQLNLRNIGGYRNLVLFDGHRIPPSSITNIVDIDMIPQALIQRVETVTGGGSAVYGSDAVTGVINFITNRNFNGIGAHAQYGVSDYGDGEAVNAGVVAGMDLFDGRGHIEGSYEYRNDKGILHRSDRPWSNQWIVGGNGSAATPYRLVEYGRISNSSFGGLITSGVLSGQDFAVNGTLSPFVHGVSLGSNREIGGNGVYQDTSMKAPLESNQLFGRFDIDVTDDVHGYLVASANLKTNQIYGDAMNINNVTLSAQNAFLPASYQTQLANAGQTTFRLSKYVQNAPRFNPEPKSDQYFFNAGLEGDLGDYNWNVSLVHGWTKLSTTLHSDPNNEHLAAALDAVRNPANGQIVCNVTLTNPGLYPGCVPLNPFGPTAASQEAINYVLGDVHFVGTTKMDSFTADIAGEPFSTWAGPVNVALSGEWRKLRYEATSDGQPSDTTLCTGLRFNNCKPPPGGTIVFAQTFPSYPAVSQTVKEAAIEFDAPLVKDVPLIQSFNLNGAARFTSYDTSGDYTTWKAGLDWHINDEFRFRGTQSKDIRAPTLNDLFAPVSIIYGNYTDRLTVPNQSNFVPGFNYGNKDLKSEIGKTTTAGFVWHPNWLPRFSVALDFYRIVISDAIFQTQGFQQPVQDACYASAGSSLYCALQVRPGGFDPNNPADTAIANTATGYNVQPLNVSELETKGADLEVNYTGDLFDHPITVRGLVAYQPHIYYRDALAGTSEQGGVAFGPTGLTAAPVWRLTAFVSYKPTENFSVDVMTRWRSSLLIQAERPNIIRVNNRIASWASTNLNLAYDMNLKSSKVGLFLNIQNVFDKAPPPAQNGSNPGLFGGWAGSDDPTGRYYTLGVRYRH